MKIDKRKSIISLLLATSISLNASLLTSCSPSKKPTESNDSSEDNQSKSKPSTDLENQAIQS